MKILELQTVDEWQELFSKNQAAPHGMLILKFSSRCPISRSVEREFDAWAGDLADDAGVVCVKVNVVNARPLSQHLAEALRVQHESPQAIWITAGPTVRWHASHYAVTKHALTTQLQAV